MVYRGGLKAAESGAPGNPIRLTSDPDWGEGSAAFYGSTRITGGWKKAGPGDAPGIPAADRVWYIDLGKDYDPDGRSAEQTYSAKFSSMWQVSGGKVERLHIARDPELRPVRPQQPRQELARLERLQRARERQAPSPRRS